MAVRGGGVRILSAEASKDAVGTFTFKRVIASRPRAKKVRGVNICEQQRAQRVRGITRGRTRATRESSVNRGAGSSV